MRARRRSPWTTCGSRPARSPCLDGAIEIDGVALGHAITISAIGSPPGLRSAIERPGGILTLLQQSIDAVFTVDERTNLVVPGTRRDLTPQVARSVE